MRALALGRGAAIPPGLVLAQDVRDSAGRTVLDKGMEIGRAHV